MKTDVFAADKQFIRDSLRKKIADVFVPIDTGPHRLISFSQEVNSLSAMNWLASQTEPVKMYWSSRDADWEAAGVGWADVVDSEKSPGLSGAIDRIEQNLSNASENIRYYGGICFDADHSAPVWKDFGHYYFLVPRFELRRENDRHVFSFNMLAGQRDSIHSITKQFLDAFDKLSFDDRASITAIPVVLQQFDSPCQDDWQRQIAKLTDFIRTGCVNKIVQTRVTCFELDSQPDPLFVLDRIRSRNIHTYDFCFQTDEGRAFIGCSPECLYRKERNRIQSEALAGTNAVTDDQGLNRRLQRDLLGSEKEAEEHAYVFEDVKSGLKGICEEVAVIDEREILSLEYVQHLRSQFEGTLKKGVSNKDILGVLHPTAAVNGYPQEAAMAYIRRSEPFSRGWYAGPVGWIGRDRSEFAVAIRSAYITGQQMRLFAGAGIVGDSDPSQEWVETEIKMAPFLNLFEPSLKS
jgi:menaquinone-specific isochorismate synthase